MPYGCLLAVEGAENRDEPLGYFSSLENYGIHFDFGASQRLWISINRNAELVKPHYEMCALAPSPICFGESGCVT